MTERYFATFNLYDDDPAPTIQSIKWVDSTVREGETARLEIVMSGPTDQFLYGIGKFVTPPRLPQVRGVDVPERWIQRYFYSPDGYDRPLSRLHGRVFFGLDNSTGRGIFLIPIVADHKKEGPEFLTLRLKVLGQVVAKTLKVID